MHRRAQGVALISVLLLLSAMLVMAAAMQMLTLLGALSTRNQLALAQAEADMHTQLTHSLILLEDQLLLSGELPLWPALPSDVSYQRLDSTHARLLLRHPQPPQLGKELMVALQGSRLQVVQSN